jgi:hypothetical protein
MYAAVPKTIPCSVMAGEVIIGVGDMLVSVRPLGMCHWRRRRSLPFE